MSHGQQWDSRDPKLWSQVLESVEGLHSSRSSLQNYRMAWLGGDLKSPPVPPRAVGRDSFHQARLLQLRLSLVTSQQQWVAPSWGRFGAASDFCSSSVFSKHPFLSPESQISSLLQQERCGYCGEARATFACLGQCASPVSCPGIQATLSFSPAAGTGQRAGAGWAVGSRGCSLQAELPGAAAGL